MFDVESNGIAEVIKYKYLGGCKAYRIIIGIETLLMRECMQNFQKKWFVC